LKLWLSVKTFGMASFRAAIAHGFHLARFAESQVRAMPDWEVVTPAQMAILCFRRRGADDAFHLKLVDAMVRDGYALITSTVLKCGTVLRVCPINPRSTEADIATSLDRLDSLARRLKS
ncbi:MAG: pyridoxal-dependent decarboxylase, partial [Acidobacteriota bacterium]|nr:pyridoxal-dependent decarboxylase [Acidobacteriota bacterium]